MCGICGLAHSSTTVRVDEQRLTQMRDVMVHRGPDGFGNHCAAGVGLGHRRLSIIDLEGGGQPMSNEDGAVWVTYNGEIYNHVEIRARLSRAGHRFRTQCDTEVLVHAYEEWGDQFPRQLNGMFAFAIHDLKRHRVLLGRDHLGIKPLFYAVKDDTLVFGSEIKAVLTGLRERARVNPEVLQEYLIFRYAAGSRSFFDGVSRLRPGHIAVWEGGRLTISRFWTPPAEPGLRDADLTGASQRVEALLIDSVESQMMSDVPLGSFCSGGVDSGLVTGYAAQASPHRLQSFAVGFRDPAWDESREAAETAAHFGTDHHTVLSQPDEFVGLLKGLIWHHDEPLNHPNTIPLYQLSRVARKSVKVVLTGEGADETFHGYPRYQIARIRSLLGFMPLPVRKAAAGVASTLPGHRGEKLGRLLTPPISEGLILNSAYVDPGLVRRLTGGPVDGALAERRVLLEEARVNDDDVDTLSRYELLTYVVCALDRMDRMSMACSLEARVPFLDLPLLELALGIPTKLKSGYLQTKRVLKSLGRQQLPPGTADRRKSGFGLPLDDWFRSPILSPAMERLLDHQHPATEHLDATVVEEVVRQHASGEAQNGEVLWLLANVYAWCEVFQDSGTAPPDIPGH